MPCSRQRVATGVPDSALLQDGHDLAVSKFRCFHAESPASILRENSTFTPLFIFRGLPHKPILNSVY